MLLFFEQTNSVGLGMILCDGYGHFVACKTVKLDGICHVGEAEALALLEALQWVSLQQFSHVRFELDAKIMVNAITSAKVDLS